MWSCAFLAVQGPDDEPVWRRVLQYHLNDSNPAVARQAAAALRGSVDHRAAPQGR